MNDDVITKQPVNENRPLDQTYRPFKHDRVEDCCVCACCLGPIPAWANQGGGNESRRGSATSSDDHVDHASNENNVEMSQNHQDKSSKLDIESWGHGGNEDCSGGQGGGHSNENGDCFDSGGCYSGGDDGGGDCGGDCGGGD